MAFPQTTQCSLLVWHVHGSWMDSFVVRAHRYLIPVNATRDPDGRVLCGRDWPRAREVPPAELRNVPRQAPGRTTAWIERLAPRMCKT